MQNLYRFSQRPLVGIAGYSALGSVVLFLYSSANRPLWYDEMVYFVLGGFDTTQEVLGVIQETTTNVNQGVTGAYMLLDYWSLTVFGAHLWALRLPSLVFGVYLLLACAVFLRSRNVPWLATWALPVLLIGQQTLMYYVGEARTYMPLVAAVVGVLAYYFIPLDQRRRLVVRLLGWSAVLIGVLFHPYFALYWPVLMLFAAAVQDQWRNLIRFANPLLVAIGFIIYVVIGALTWMRGQARTESLDPFFWLQDPLWRAITAQLFQGIYVERLLVVLLAALVLLALVLSVRNRSDVLLTLRVWWPPVFLMLIAWLTALALSLVSLQQGFWIIPRQWIASIGLTAVAFVWLWSSAIRRVASVSGIRAAFLVSSGLLLLIVLSALEPAIGQWRQLESWRSERAALLVDDVPSRGDLSDRIEEGQAQPETVIGDAEWVDFANANTIRGGDVWPEFSRYYRDRDWNTFILGD